MKWIGCLLLVSGWMIVAAALLLLTTLGLRFAFVGAGLLVEFLGLALLALSYQTPLKSPRSEGSLRGSLR